MQLQAGRTPEISELIHLYEVTVMSMNAYYSQVWQRFNWFLTLQVASFGFYFSSIPSTLGANIGVPSLGLFLSILWFLMGFEDFRSSKKHDTRMTEIRKIIYESMNLSAIAAAFSRSARIFHQN